MPNFFLTRDKRDKTQSKGYWRSKKQEKTIANKLGGKVVGGSVSRPSGHIRHKGKTHRGDVQIKDVARIEAKTTSADSFRVTKDMIEKITSAGIGHGEVPAIVIEFLDPLGKPEQEVAVIPMWALQQLIANGSKD